MPKDELPLNDAGASFNWRAWERAVSLIEPVPSETQTLREEVGRLRAALSLLQHLTTATDLTLPALVAAVRGIALTPDEDT